MQKVCSEFFQEASAHCRDEVEVMTRINVNLTREAVKAMQCRLSKEAALIVFDVTELLIPKAVEQVRAI